VLFLAKYFKQRMQSPVSAEHTKNKAKYQICGLGVKISRLIQVLVDVFCYQIKHGCFVCCFNLAKNKIENHRVISDFTQCSQSILCFIRSNK